MPSEPRATIEKVASRLSHLTRVCCLSGAGISAESGIPTFRGRGGLWQGRRVEEVATPEAFAQDPQGVWEFYNERRASLTKCKPNPAHFALAELENHYKDWLLITQNVDGFHRLAGSHKVIELHGNIWTVRCTDCAQEAQRIGVSLGKRPTCDACGGLLRPGVVWFGELIPPDALTRARQALEQCQAMIVVGTSSIVQPAASMAYWAKSCGAWIVEINLEKTSLSGQADVSIQGKAGDILPKLADIISNPGSP